MQPTPEGIVRDVPRLLDFQPTSSIVAHNTHTDGTTSVLRVDLPDLGSPTRHTRHTITEVLTALANLERTTLVIYTASPWQQAKAHAHHIQNLARALQDAQLTIDYSLLHAADGWGTIDSDHPTAHRNPTSTSTSLRDLTRLPRTTADEHRTFHNALTIGRQRTLLADATTGPLDTATLTETALTEYDIPHTAYLLTRLLDDPDARTTTLNTLTWGTTTPRPEHPDPHRLSRSIELTRTMAAYAETPAARVLALELTAHLHYTAGNTTLADAYLAQALSLDPDNQHAEHLSTLIDTGILPHRITTATDRPLATCHTTDRQ
jgi:hypothetical protein